MLEIYFVPNSVKMDTWNMKKRDIEMYAHKNHSRPFSLIGIHCLVILLGVTLLLMPIAVIAGGGSKGGAVSGTSVSGSGGMSLERRTELMVEIARLQGVSATNAAYAEGLNKTIAIVQAFDLMFATSVSLVPFGSAVYGFSKAITFATVGEEKWAKDAAIDGAIGLVTSLFSGAANLAKTAAPKAEKVFSGIVATTDIADIANFVFREMPKAKTVGENLGEALAN